jgi:hypothetical protein
MEYNPSEKLIGTQLVKQYHEFYEIQRFSVHKSFPLGPILS